MSDNPPFFITWCRSQDAFHTETLDEMLSNNSDNYFGIVESPSDWIVVGVANTRIEASNMASELKRRKEMS